MLGCTYTAPQGAADQETTMFTYAAAAQHGTEAALIALDECGPEFARTMLASLEANTDKVTPEYLAAFRTAVTA
jgi:hypothetical protein